MKRSIEFFGLTALVLLGSTSALALGISPEPTGTSAANLASATLAPGSGITIVGGSESYTSAADNQGGTYTNFSISNSSETIALPNDGVVLTSGLATGILVPDNTDPSFDGNLGSGGGDTDTEAVLTNAGAPNSNTNDINVLEFQFTVDPGITSVSADFVFGTDEFPNQGVTDIFTFFVDGVNYAEFSDGSLIFFELGGTSAAFYNDNDVGSADPFSEAGGSEFQYDGITDALMVTGLLDTNLMTHTLKIVVADTSDFIFDSAVFIGGLTAGTSTGGGITPPGGTVVPIPAPLALLLTGLVGMGLVSRRSGKA